MSMNNAATFGFRRGLPFNLGIWVGFSLIMILCALFSVALYAVIPRIQLPMKILGALYMLYLAWRTLQNSPLSVDRTSDGKFWAGFALQFANPKIVVYGITAMSSFILPSFSSPIVLVLFAFLLSSVGATANLSWALFGALFMRLFARHTRVIDFVLAALLVYCAVSLFL